MFSAEPDAAAGSSAQPRSPTVEGPARVPAASAARSADKPSAIASHHRATASCLLAASISGVLVFASRRRDAAQRSWGLLKLVTSQLSASETPSFSQSIRLRCI
jgi:hypothetical protein